MSKIITVVGAGGKTTVAKTLGNALSRMGKRALFTTTTQIRRPADIPVTVGGIETISPAIGLSSAAKEQTAAGKLKGFSGEEIDVLAQKDLFDFIIVEADGAKGRPLKAPEAWEPVYPAATFLAIGIIGLDCLGQPLSDRVVHRSARFAKITGANPGETLTLRHLLALVRHPDGLFRYAPPGAKKVLLLNKADLYEVPRAAILKFTAGSGLSVLLVSRDANWADAFIHTYFFTEGYSANE